MVIYLAGPLFSRAEQAFNRALGAAITACDPALAVVLPQDNAKSFSAGPGGNRAIFDECLKGVREADIVVAVLDGEDVDSGTAVEIGYALALGRPIVGLRTDFRGGEERGVNLMVAFACDTFIFDPDASIADLAARIAEFCRRPPMPARAG